MSKKKNRRQVRHQADTAGAREAAFEAELVRERAMAVKATGVINNAEAVALGVLQEAGWKVEWDAMEGGHGQPYAFLLTAPGACEQVLEATTAISLIKAARELGTPDLYPQVEYAETEAEFVEKLERSIEQADAGEIRPLSEIYPLNADPVLVNGYDGDPWMTCKVRAFHNAIATFHMSTKVIELPSSFEETSVAGFLESISQMSIIEAAHRVYVSGRGDIVALAEGENPFTGEGVAITDSFIQVQDRCEELGMVFRGNGGYNGYSGYFEYPRDEGPVANLFPHPATHSLFKTAPRGVGTDPISGALIAPLGKTFELVNQVMGKTHRQKTIKSAAWVTQGWTAQVVTL